MEGEEKEIILLTVVITRVGTRVGATLQLRNRTKNSKVLKIQNGRQKQIHWPMSERKLLFGQKEKLERENV